MLPFGHPRLLATIHLNPFYLFLASIKFVIFVKFIMSFDLVIWIAGQLHTNRIPELHLRRYSPKFNPIWSYVRKLRKSLFMKSFIFSISILTRVLTFFFRHSHCVTSPYESAGRLNKKLFCIKFGTTHLNEAQALTQKQQKVYDSHSLSQIFLLYSSADWSCYYGIYVHCM